MGTEAGLGLTVTPVMVTPELPEVVPLDAPDVVALDAPTAVPLDDPKVVAPKDPTVVPPELEAVAIVVAFPEEALVALPCVDALLELEDAPFVVATAPEEAALAVVPVELPVAAPVLALASPLVVLGWPVVDAEALVLEVAPETVAAVELPQAALRLKAAASTTMRNRTGERFMVSPGVERR